MARIAVLGGGLVGSLVATELARKHSVSLLDPDQRALEQLARHAPAADLQAERFSSARQLAGCDLALNCLPGSMAGAARQTVQCQVAARQLPRGGKTLGMQLHRRGVPRHPL